MRISGFVVLVVCLLCTATAASAASSAVGACSCIGAEQGIPMHTGYSGYRTQYSRARATYGVQPRSVVVRRAPYQAAQAPRYRYGGRPIVQQPAVQYWTYQAQYPRVVRQAYRGQRRPVVDRRAPHRETQAPRYAYGGGQIVQHPADRRASNQEAKAPRYASGGGEIVQHQTDRRKSTRKRRRRAMRTPAARSFSIPPAARRGCSAAAVRASRRSGVPFAIFGSCRTGTGFRAPHRPPAWPYCGVRAMSPSSGGTTATAPQCSMTPTAARGSPACIVSA